MNKITACLVAMSIALAFSGNILAYEGGTKLVATMAHPEKANIQSNLSLSSLEYGFGGTKLVVQFLHRLPKPTLSGQRIREEKPGPSLGTKSTVRFQKKGWF